MILFSLAVIIGLVLLVWSADRFVFASATMAHRLNVSPFLIGITVVSIGTSAPEIVVSTMASLNDAGPLAIGNALGSNIANIGLVLGATALVTPIAVDKSLVKRELPMLLVVTLATGYFLYDLQLTLLDSIALLVLLTATLYLVFYKNDTSASMDEIDELNSAEAENMPKWQIAAWFVVGLVVLLLSAKLLVWGATNIAISLGVSQLVIGLTIVAIGTSLPELAASIASAVKGHHSMAIGNVVGSNLFNLLMVLPIPGLIATTNVESSVITRDYITLLASTVFLVVLIGFFKEKTRIGRFVGCILLTGYCSYLLWIYQAQKLA